MRTRRSLLAGLGGAVVLAGCTGSDDQPSDDAQSTAGDAVEITELAFRNDAAGAAPAELLDRPVIDQEATPTLYHETENIPDGTEITIELAHQPYPEAETPRQDTTTLNTQLTGTTTHLTLENYQPGKYQATTTIHHPNGHQLHQNQQTIYITPTQQQKQELRETIEGQFQNSAGSTDQQTLNELEIGRNDTEIYMHTESDEEVNSSELGIEAGGVLGTHQGSCRKLGIPYALELNIDATGGQKNAQVSQKNIEKYLQGEGRGPPGDELKSQFDI